MHNFVIIYVFIILNKKNSVNIIKFLKFIIIIISDEKYIFLEDFFLS